MTRAVRPAASCLAIILLSAALVLLLPRLADAQVSQGVFATLVSFTDFGTYPGSNPSVAPILDGQGNLYGVTEDGDTNNDGTLYEYTPATNTFTTLLVFTGTSSTAIHPQDLTSDGQGNLYGTTLYGGTPGDGTLYEYTPSTNAFTSLISFSGDSGADLGQSPYAAPTADGLGNLFGTTLNGGTNDDGTLYEYTPSTSTFTSLVSFSGTGGADLGSGPEAALTADGKGDFFGTTTLGGTNSDGTIFEYTPRTNTFTSLVSFTGTDGAAPGNGPYASLTSDGKGSFYGTTKYGGVNSYGTLFKYTVSTNTFTNLVTFTGASGAAPGSSPNRLVLDGAGNLFGTTLSGGAGNFGTVFEYAPSTNAFTSLVSFTGSAGTAIGSTPGIGLALSSSGVLYGTTDYNGSNNSGNGTLFSLSGVATATAPEPSAWAVFAVGALGLGVLGIKTRRRMKDTAG